MAVPLTTPHLPPTYVHTPTNDNHPSLSGYTNPNTQPPTPNSRVSLLRPSVKPTADHLDLLSLGLRLHHYIAAHLPEPPDPFGGPDKELVQSPLNARRLFYPGLAALATLQAHTGCILGKSREKAEYRSCQM